MRIVIRSACALTLVAVGYVLGSSGAFHLAVSRAQEAGQGPSSETVDKIRAANESLNAAMQVLQQEDRYTPAINGINAFAITAGGANAIRDLETGRGVDPETFAGLYAGEAIDEVAQHLSRDEQGRLTYKNKVVRMYPISRLKNMFANRINLAGGGSEGN